MEIEEYSLDIERAGEERTLPPAMFRMVVHIWIPTTMKTSWMLARLAWCSLQFTSATFADHVVFHGAKFALELLT